MLAYDFTGGENGHNDEVSSRQRYYYLRVVGATVRPFPKRPTALYRGKRLGLDVAVVAKNSNKNESSRLPPFLRGVHPP